MGSQRVGQDWATNTNKTCGVGGGLGFQVLIEYTGMVTTNPDRCTHNLQKTYAILERFWSSVLESYGFPVVMYRCDSWTIKKAEELMLLKAVLKTLEGPPDCKEIRPVNPKRNQPWILIERTDAEAEAPILWQPDARSWLIWMTLMLGKIEGRRRRGRRRTRWLDGITDSMDMSWVKSRSWWWTGRPGVSSFMGSERVRHDWATELNWTDDWLIFHCTYIPPLLYPFLCWWTFRLFDVLAIVNNKCWRGCGEKGTLLVDGNGNWYSYDREQYGSSL